MGSWGNLLPEDIIGVIPSSMSVPLLDANIMRSQYKGSPSSLSKSSSVQSNALTSVGGNNAIQRHLTHDQEDEKCKSLRWEFDISPVLINAVRDSLIRQS